MFVTTDWIYKSQSSDYKIHSKVIPIIFFVQIFFTFFDFQLF